MAAAILGGLLVDAAVIPPSAAPLFADGFESGDLSAWTASTGLAVQQEEVFAGRYAARGVSNGTATYAYRQLSSGQSNLYALLHVKVINRSGPVTLLRFQRGTGTSVVQLHITKTGLLAYRNEVAGINRLSSTTVESGVWHTLQTHVHVNGDSSTVEVWLDEEIVPGLSRTESLGSALLKRIELGNRATGRNYDVAFDDVAVDTGFISEIDAPPTAPSNLRLVDSPVNDVSLAWDPSTDESGVAGYTVYRDNIEIGSVPGTTTEFVDTPPSTTTVYVYTVVAFDATGNRSERAAPLRVVMSGFGPLSTTAFAGGDIACASKIPTATSCWQAATSDILVEGVADAVLPLGDLQYEKATLTAILKSFDPTWGRVKASMRPTTGNHEYNTPEAAGYFDYFGDAAGDRAKGYYSFDLGAWHAVALNSNCFYVACAAGSAQEVWLREDLAAHANLCTLAYWHAPVWSSTDPEHSVGMPFMEALYQAGADLVLVAHDHVYERFAPQDPSGQLDPDHGIPQFIVGTGGRSLYNFKEIQPNSEARNNQAFGVLKLTLHPESYEWSFVPAWGDDPYTDAGRHPCHSAPTP